MEDQSERIRELVAWLAFQNSYWGYLFSRIRRVASTSIPSIMGVAPTINGTIVLLFHPKLVSETKNDALKLIIEHEGMHVLNKHIPRLIRILANEVDPIKKYIQSQIFNTAADCAVNPVMNMPREITIGGRLWKGCFPDLYNLPDDKATEYYYKELFKQVKVVEIPGGGQGLQFGGAGEDYDQIGDHSQWDSVSTKVTDMHSLSRKLDSYVQGIIKDSIKNFKRKRGTVPGYISELIDAALLPPQIPYYQLIRKLIRGSRLSKFKRAFSKVNRKRTYVFTIGAKNLPQISPFPGRTRDFSFNIVVLIDTSGSMSVDDIKEGLSGVKNIIENDRHCHTTILEASVGLQKEYEVKKIRDIDFNIKDRGGTTLYPALVRARELKPDVTLCFTDGCCDDINAVPRKTIPRRIIWVIQKDGSVDCVNKTGFIVRV